jgi:hypothetical protein
MNMDFTVQQLKKRFIEEQVCHDVIPTSLNIYKLFIVATDEELRQMVSAPLNKEKPLIAAKKLRDCNIGEKEILFVELPCALSFFFFFTFSSLTLLLRGDRILPPPQSREYFRRRCHASVCGICLGIAATHQGPKAERPSTC